MKNKQLGVMAHACHPSYVEKKKWEAYGPASPGHKNESLFENNYSKKGGGLAQVVDGSYASARP
jgi:hypothetical protein